MYKRTSQHLKTHLQFTDFNLFYRILTTSVRKVECTCERTEVCSPLSAPLIELERDKEGVDDARASPTDCVVAFRS